MKEYLGGCHCGEIKFKFYSEESVEIWKCNCSICKMLDYDHLFVGHDDFKIIKGNELLSEYFFGILRHFQHLRLSFLKLEHYMIHKVCLKRELKSLHDNIV